MVIIGSSVSVALTLAYFHGCRCIDALVTMGVLVPGGDRTAVRRTAEFFLKNFEVSGSQPLL